MTIRNKILSSICKKETQNHIDQVNSFMKKSALEIEKRGKIHDASKLKEPEFEYFKKLASTTDRGLLFLETIEQCDSLPYPSVHSKNKESDYNLEQFKEGKIPILSSIGQLKAGITFKNLNTCIILHCYSSNNKAIQKIGRALNYVEGEKATIHIICLNNTIDFSWCKKGLADLDQSKIKFLNK